MTRWTALLVLLALGAPAAGAEPSGAQVMERALRAFYYPGEDMQARVRMELVASGGEVRTRVLSMVRRDESEGGNQKYFLYFHEPGDVRRLALLVWKYPDRDDDRWLYVPAVDLVRRVDASDRRSRFVGSDFTYEDISGRGVAADDHRLVGREKLDGREVWRVESTPREPAEYARKVSWIDTGSYLPLREEYYDRQGELARVFTADEISQVGSYPTVVRRTMADVKSGHRTVVILQEVRYDLGLRDEDFGERSLRRPPREWVR